uniref:Bm4693 n=1 Tax=Brugia malayi TaxID=6279 RepID=A0A1I9G593_BRUMA|nr:Bm4693 [Brugia malayi]
MPSNTIKYPKGCKPVSAGIKNTELLKRLKVLSEMLKGEATNEEADAPNRYKDLMLHLTDSQFLSNKNGDVQLLLACCIADLFRIFAPNSPLENQSLLKVRYNNFQNILVVETMQLALELGDDAHVILRQLIKQFFNNINKQNADEHVQRMLMAVCSKLIQGVDQISNIVLDAIFFFLVQPQKVCFFIG